MSEHWRSPFNISEHRHFIELRRNFSKADVCQPHRILSKETWGCQFLSFFFNKVLGDDFECFWKWDILVFNCQYIHWTLQNPCFALPLLIYFCRLMRGKNWIHFKMSWERSRTWKALKGWNSLHVHFTFVKTYHSPEAKHIANQTQEPNSFLLNSFKLHGSAPGSRQGLKSNCRAKRSCMINFNLCRHTVSRQTNWTLNSTILAGQNMQIS